MLGKTNITALQEGGTVTEIEDYSWIQMQSGIRSDFVKAINKNGYLVGITQDGYVAYTKDGEVWENNRLDYDQCKINDIDWDGDRFILVGSYMDTGLNTDDTTALAVTTSDFKAWKQLGEVGDGNQYGEYLSVYLQNGRYILAVREQNTHFEYLVQTDFATESEERILIQSNMNGTKHRGSLVAKNTTGVLLYIRTRSNGNSNDSHDVYKVTNSARKRITGISNRGTGDIYTVFECKDALYVQKMNSEDNYDLCKITDAGETMIMSTGCNFGFVGGVYFDNCEIFINRHQMMILRKGESFAGKTLEDLIEVAPELAMNCITKAFGQLFIFGNQGVILRSSVETNNEEAVAVQVISAKRALADAKIYTDKRYEALESRIAALEAR